MRPSTPPQELLFDIRPEGTPVPVAERPITPGCLLPVPANMVVDIRRAERIFGLSDMGVMKLIETGCITGYRTAPSRPWSIAYSSIVEFCDRLRIEHCIRDRRPKLAPGRRWRDEDLLPFPLTDTVKVEDAIRGLDSRKDSVLKLIEEGQFEAYRFYDRAVWRISKTSLFEYAERLKQQLAQHGHTTSRRDLVRRISRRT